MMPDNAFGTAASPNYWLTQVLDLSDITGATWRRAALDGAWMTLDTVTPAIWAGQTFTGKYAATPISVPHRHRDHRRPLVAGAVRDRPAAPLTADMIAPHRAGHPALWLPDGHLERPATAAPRSGRQPPL